MSSRFSRLCVALVVLSAPVVAQQSKSEVGRLSKELSSNLPSKFELLLTRYRFEEDGTGQKELLARIRILSSSGVVQRSQMSFEYRPFSDELQIRYVRVRKKNGTVENIETRVPEQYPNATTQKYDYDERRVRLPGLAVGDLVEYDVVVMIRRPLAQGEFCVQHSFNPTAFDERLTIDVPKERNIKWKAAKGVSFSETNEGKRRMYRWDNQEASRPVVKASPYSSVQPPDVQVSSFMSWEEVGHWYSELEKPHRLPSSEIKAKADELTKHITSDIGKVEALYNFAAKRIKYISLVSLGIDGYEPHSAAETIHNGYGDCKDKTTLLRALLEAEGLHTSAVLISADRGLDIDLPSPWYFDHAIAVVYLGTEEIWMDPSPAVLPFRMLPYALRGKRGLVIPSDGASHLGSTPTGTPAPNTYLEEVDGKISADGTLEVTVSITARGDAELPIRQAFVSSVESANPWTVMGVLKGIKAKARQVSDVKIADPVDTSKAFTLSFRLCEPGFIVFAKNEGRFRLPLANIDLPSAEEQGVTDIAGGWHRVGSEPVRLGPPGERSYRLKLELPRGSSFQLPGFVSLNQPGVSYRAIYSSNAGSLSAKRDLILTSDYLAAKFRQKYASFSKKVVADVKQILTVRVGGTQTQAVKSPHAGTIRATLAR
jgi:hypothetical protein